VSLPLRRLDRARIPCDRAHPLLASHHPAWGFPLSCVRRRGGREEGEWGKREGGEKGEVAHRDTAGAPRSETARARVEPDQSPREKPEPSATGGRPEQSKEQGAAVNVYTAPPSSSGQRRLHHRPAVSVVAPFPLTSFTFFFLCL
jgi:hypothetical protein